MVMVSGVGHPRPEEQKVEKGDILINVKNIYAV